MRIYLSGPITNEPNYRRNFKVAQDILAENGYLDVVNPAELCQVISKTGKDDYEMLMDVCINMLRTCDIVLFLPKWKTSHGCGREYQFALDQDLVVMDFEDFVNSKGA